MFIISIKLKEYILKKLQTIQIIMESKLNTNKFQNKI